jgi:RNA polymerase sigma factor (sigma-70 family)
MSSETFTLEKLYKEHFQTVNKFIQKNSGTKQDAEDIFQDTLIVLIEKLKKDDFKLTASLKTYIVAIAKNLWFKKLRDNRINVTGESFENLSEKFYSEIETSIENEKTYWDKLSMYMSNVSDHCKKILDMFYFERKTIEEIQTHFGYTTKHNAQNQKYKCVEQLKSVKEKDE